MTTVKDLMKELRNALNEAKDYAPHVTRNKNLIKEADALIDSSALEAQAAEIERLKSDNEDLRRDEALNDAEAKIAELQSKLDAMQSVEPVAWLSKHGHMQGRYEGMAKRHVDEYNAHKDWQCLYTHPKVAERHHGITKGQP